MFLIIILEIQSGGQQKQFVSFLESSALPRFCAAHNAMHLCFLYVFCVRGQQIGTHVVLHIKYPVLDLHLINVFTFKIPILHLLWNHPAYLLWLHLHPLLPPRCILTPASIIFSKCNTYACST